MERVNLLHCQSCNFSTTSPGSYSAHQVIHSLSKNFLFRCPFCRFQASGKRSLEVHICREHKERCPEPSPQPQYLHLPTSASVSCSVTACSHKSSTVQDLVNHLTSHLKNGEPIRCPFGACTNPPEQLKKNWVVVFSKIQNFKSHMSRYHKQATLPAAPTPFHSCQSISPDSSFQGQEEGTVESSESDHEDGDAKVSEELYTANQVCDYIAQFYLKLEGQLFVPASTVQAISEDLSNIVQFSHNIVKKTLVEELLKINVSQEDANRIAFVSLSDDPLFRVHNKNFAGHALTSEHLRYEYYKKHYGFEKPRKVEIQVPKPPVHSEDHLPDVHLEENVDDPLVTSGPRIASEPNITPGPNIALAPLIIPVPPPKNTKPKVVHIVNVAASLAHQLRDPQVQKYVDESLKKVSSGAYHEPFAGEKMYSDFTDGEVFASHSASRERSLFLLFSWDGFGTTNPIGPAKNSHKTVGVYYLLGNLPPNKRSKVDILQLSALFFEENLKKKKAADSKRDKKERLDVCLEPVIEELRDLQRNGIEYKGERVLVYVLFFLCDNLGAHQVAGFVETFNSLYFCRYCAVSSLEFHENPLCLPPFLRTPAEYEECAAISVAEGKNEKGVNFNSILNTLEGFHVCLPALPPCIAHDLCGGAASADMMLFIGHFIRKKWFMRIQLNQAINNFEFFGADGADRPSTIELNAQKRYKTFLSRSCVQNWNMLRYFSLIVYQYVKDENDEVWKLYLKLKLMCEMICAPKISESDIVKLDSLIQKYLVERKATFPDSKLRPKHHYLRHYPGLIRLFGPLIRVWTLRMESHHALLKRAAELCNNFIDVAYTMAFKSQLRRAYQSCGNLYGDEFTFTVPRGFVPIFADNVKEFINTLHLSSDSVCVNTVKINGTVYKKGMWLLIEREMNCLVVGEIISIFCHSSVSIIVRKRSTSIQADNRGLHEIQMEDNLGLSLVSFLESIESYYPLQAYNFAGRWYLTLKHAPCPQEIV